MCVDCGQAQWLIYLFVALAVWKAEAVSFKAFVCGWMSSSSDEKTNGDEIEDAATSYSELPDAASPKPKSERLA